MKNSGIGGQAVMEGVMMKNKEKYAVSVRLTDGSIVTDVKEYHSVTEKHKWLAWPFIRGSVNLVESMVIGMRTLTFSANFFDEETDKDKKSKKKSKDAEKTVAVEQAEAAEAEVKTEEKNPKDKEGFLSGPVLFFTMLFSFALAIGLFLFLPQFIAETVSHLCGFTIGGKICAVIEGVVKLAIFLTYIILISFMSDIKRTFMYHGAEHKSINCIEHGMPLTVENVRKSSKEHKRCGTSFIIIVFLIAIIAHMFIPQITGFGKILNFLIRFGIRIGMLPIIAGFSYEFLRIAGRCDNIVVNILSKPGLWMQALTTKEPTDDMIEVAIKSVEEVFDWRAFLDENFPGEKC